MQHWDLVSTSAVSLKDEIYWSPENELAAVPPPPQCSTAMARCERYDKNDSIKQMERRRRGAGETTLSHQITGLREVSNYWLFLKGSANKAALTAFVCGSIAASAPAQLKQNNTIILAGEFAGGETAKLVINSGVVIMPHLFSTQEEADTRLVIHVIDLATTHTRVSVRCDDTDVLVLLFYYYDRRLLADAVYMHAGHAWKLSLESNTIPSKQSLESLATG